MEYPDSEGQLKLIISYDQLITFIYVHIYIFAYNQKFSIQRQSHGF